MRPNLSSATATAHSLGLRSSRAAWVLIGAFVGCTAFWTMTTLWGTPLGAAHLPVIRLDTSPWMLMGPSTLPGLHLTSLATNTFVATPSSPISLLFLCALAAAFAWPTVRYWWRAKRMELVLGVAALFAGVYLIERLLLPIVAWDLVAGSLLLLWIVPGKEARWGTRRTLIFCAIIVVATNLVGATLLWASPATLAPLVGVKGMPINGLGPLIDALIAVWILMAGGQRVFGVEVRKLIWVLIAMNSIDLVFSSVVGGVMGLFALWLARALVYGTWRPDVLIDKARLWLIDRRLKKRRGRFKVIDGGRTVHRVTG